MCKADLDFTGGKNDIGAGTDTDFIGACTPALTVEVYGLLFVLRTEAAGCLKIFVSTKLHGVTFHKTVVNVLCFCLFS